MIHVAWQLSTHTKNVDVVTKKKAYFIDHNFHKNCKIPESLVDSNFATFDSTYF